MQAQTDTLCPLRACNSSHSHTNDKCTFVQHQGATKTKLTAVESVNVGIVTVTREMSHCYPHFHHDSKISKVAWYLLVPWLRLLRLGCTSRAEFSRMEAILRFGFWLGGLVTCSTTKTHKSDSAMAPTKLPNYLCWRPCRRDIRP